MSVGHNTTDEVGLGLVEGGHQVVELALEVGGDGLAALALLPILVLWCLDRLTRMVGKALGKELNINQSRKQTRNITTTAVFKKIVTYNMYSFFVKKLLF